MMTSISSVISSWRSLGTTRDHGLLKLIAVKAESAHARPVAVAAA